MGYPVSMLAHTTLSVQRFMTKNKMAAVPHMFTLPDLAPCNIMFLKMKFMT
jgi:hypothetical protein